MERFGLAGELLVKWAKSLGFGPFVSLGPHATQLVEMVYVLGVESVPGLRFGRGECPRWNAPADLAGF